MTLQMKIFLKIFYAEMKTSLMKKNIINAYVFTKKFMNNENENTIIVK